MLPSGVADGRAKARRCFLVGGCVSELKVGGVWRVTRERMSGEKVPVQSIHPAQSGHAYRVDGDVRLEVAAPRGRRVGGHDGSLSREGARKNRLKQMCKCEDCERGP